MCKKFCTWEYFYTELITDLLMVLLIQKTRYKAIQWRFRLIKASEYLKDLCMPKGEKPCYIPFSMMFPCMWPHLRSNGISVIYLFIRTMPCMVSTVALPNRSSISLASFSHPWLSTKSPSVYISVSTFSPTYINISLNFLSPPYFMYVKMSHLLFCSKAFLLEV